MSAPEAHRAIDAIWHIESSRLIAALVRVTGDVGLAEDFAQDALLAALRTWPETGVPDNPGAWLMAAAKNRALDHLRRVCEQHDVPYAFFSGELSRAEKDAAIAHFRDHARVLLSTGAGGEGRNLQFADTIVNFDLPWNPMRIEQRVGRVHRIGQNHDVFVFNYCQKGTVEEQILRVLHDKINMFELVVGEMDAILGTLDDQRDFAEIVMDLWISGSE